MKYYLCLVESKELIDNDFNMPLITLTQFKKLIKKKIAVKPFEGELIEKYFKIREDKEIMTTTEVMNYINLKENITCYHKNVGSYLLRNFKRKKRFGKEGFPIQPK